MGVTLGQAIVYLLGDRKGLDKTLDSSEKDTKSWATNLGSNVNKLVGGALLAGGAAVVAGVAAVGGIAVSTANDVAVAQGKIQSQLALTDQQANQFGQTIRDVYANNFGESIEDVGASLATVSQNLERVGVTAQDELGKATENALALRDAFEVDVAQSTDAAAALMDHLGLSSQEAFDFITTGLQDSRINNEDFLETIGEYSNLFGEAGFTADEFYSTLASGSQAGLLGTDKIADAVKEFGIRFNEQNDGLIESFDALGLSYDDLKSQVDDGTITMADAFGMVTQAVADSELPATELNAIIAGMGTQFEDLGATAVGEVDLINSSLSDMEGATDTLNAQYNNLGSFMEGLKRRAQVGLEPIGRIILHIANQAMPFLEAGFERLMGFIDRLAQIISMTLGEAFLVLEEGGTPLEALLGFVDQLLYMLGFSQEEIDGVKETIVSLAETIQNGLAIAMEFFTEHANEIKAAIIAIGTVLAAAGIASLVAGIVAAIASLLSPIGLVVAAVGVLAAAWEGNWFGIRDKVMAVIDFIRPYIETAINAIKQFWADNGDAILAKAQEIWDSIKTNISERMDSIKEKINFALELIKTIFSAFKSAFEGDWSAFGATLREAWDMVWNRIKERFTNAKTQLTNLARQVVTGIREKFTNTDWGELGRQIITGIANAITAGAGAIADAARAAAEAALEAAKAFLGIESPSKVAGEEVGDPFVTGIANRIAAGVKKLKDAAVVTVRGALSGAASAAKNGGIVPSARPLAPALAGGGSGGDVYNININVSGGDRSLAQKIAKEVKKELDKVAKRADIKRRTRSR